MKLKNDDKSKRGMGYYIENCVFFAYREERKKKEICSRYEKYALLDDRFLQIKSIEVEVEFNVLLKFEKYFL